jgi:hypothetical protein
MIDMSVPIWIVFLFGGLAGYLLCYLIMELKIKNDKIKHIRSIVDMRDKYVVKKKEGK